MKKKLIALFCILFAIHLTVAISYGTSAVSEKTDQGSYKSQLSVKQAQYYDLMVQHYLTDEGMPTGNTSSISFQPETEIQVTVDPATGSLTPGAVSKINDVYHDIAYAYFAFTHDYPEVFWAGAVKYNVQYSYNSSGAGKITNITITLNSKYAGASSQTTVFIEGVKNAKAIIASRRADTSDYETVKAIHDYLCEHLTYNYAAAKNAAAYPEAHSAGPVFTEKQPSVVCEGYGKAFKILCNAFDIPCVMVAGTSKNEAHLWNYVELKDNWYGVDVTWDDQSTILYKYFLKGETDMMKDHNPDTTAFSDKGNISFTYPVLSKTGFLQTGSQETIAAIDTVKLSYKKKVYTGKTIMAPKLTVTDTDGNVLTAGTDYTVTGLTDKKSVGRYKVTITFKGNYTGSKTLYFNIVPKKTSSAKAVLYGYDDVKFSWSKVTGASGYLVSYKKGRGSWSKAVATTSTSYKKANLSDGVKYTFKVVPYYRTKASTVKYYDANQYKTAYTYTLKKVSGVKVAKSGTKVKVSWTNISGESGYQISKMTKKSATQKKPLTYKTTSGKYKKLSATRGRTYYYKVRAYKTVNGKNIYGPWSTVKAYKRK